MSEPDPQIPDDLRELEKMIEATRAAAGVDAVIDAITSVHARWYRSWQEAGFPEERAAQLVMTMLTAAMNAK